MISIFDIYKIGIGPSSSHTVGPMKAGKAFIDVLASLPSANQVTHIVVDIYGSLSLTGKGHHTDIAITLGLAGYLPENVDVNQIEPLIAKIKNTEKITIFNNTQPVNFSFEKDIHYHNNNLPLHENGMMLSAYADKSLILQKIYYSIGGGEIVEADKFQQNKDNKINSTATVPYPFSSAEDLLIHCQKDGLSISSLILKNELIYHCQNEINDYCNMIWRTMSQCIERGIKTEGVLPGPLKVFRRAPNLYQRLIKHSDSNHDPMLIIDWVNMYAMAVNEENAAGGRVVTAPTNGACGIVPAVLKYYDHFIHPLTIDKIISYFMTSGAMGALYKMNASISGAEVGCQGEVGVACSMAAAGLAELLGGTPEQVCIAAEIAMEHNLGLTCDPVGGQVQVPCIERNAIAAVKAINAARMALYRTDNAKVSLDKVIETMYETGKDMNAKYRETSKGGLAIKVITPCE